MMVTNKARVEGSIVEATLIKELALYCSSYYSKGDKNLHDDRENNNITQTLLVFDKVGRPLGRGRPRILDENEYKTAHNYVLFNSPEIKTFLE
jgi:hypothetical protein